MQHHLTGVTSIINKYVEQALEEYGLLIAIFLIGLICGWYFKRFFSDPNYMKQINLRFSEKDEIIMDLKSLVHERLSKVAVEEKDKSFFRKIKNFFKELPKTKKK